MTLVSAKVTRHRSHRVACVAAALMVAIAPARAQQPALVRSPWIEGTADRGIGVVDFRQLPDAKHPADSLVIYRAPGVGVLGYWVRRVVDGDQIEHALLTPTRVQPNLIEYGYEISGLPMDSLSADGRWARLLLGTTPDGRMLSGWAALDTTRTHVLRWDRYLVELGGVYLLDPKSAHFANTPGGARVASPLVPRFEADDHWLEVLERRGDWLRVRVTQPADVCGAELPKDAVRRVVWVRYLDANQRPFVWFFNRGC
jgi:hypothetical protein